MDTKIKATKQFPHFLLEGLGPFLKTLGPFLCFNMQVNQLLHWVPLLVWEPTLPASDAIASLKIRVQA